MRCRCLLGKAIRLLAVTPLLEIGILAVLPRCSGMMATFGPWRFNCLKAVTLSSRYATCSMACCMEMSTACYGCLHTSYHSSADTSVRTTFPHTYCLNIFHISYLLSSPCYAISSCVYHALAVYMETTRCLKLLCLITVCEGG